MYSGNGECRQIPVQTDEFFSSNLEQQRQPLGDNLCSDLCSDLVSYKCAIVCTAQ